MEDKINTATIREQIYSILKNRIANGEYAGGTKITDQEICNEFLVSRSPVREAFRLLQAEGLLTGNSNRSLYVRSYSKKDVSSLYQVEIMMQDTGLEILGESLDESKEAKLKELSIKFDEIYKNGSFDEYLAISELFHREIVEFCDNEILTDMYKKIELMNHQFRKISLTNKDRYNESYQEHLKIIQLLLEGNIPVAREVMKKHLSNACNIVLLSVPDTSNFESDKTITVE